MTDKQELIYHYKKNRKQRSWLFINMGLACLFYIIVILTYDKFSSRELPESLLPISIIGFSIASGILFYIAWWHRTHPATYEATIDHDRFIISYPGSNQWSFDVKIADIKRFESRNTLSHAGEGIGQTGILLHDGTFHEISMNYGNSLNDIYKAIKSINPNVEFPTKVNQKVSGILEKDYDN